MRKIYVIGTIHNMLPKHKDELKIILQKINPDQIMIEIVNKDLAKNNIKKYPKEMIYAYRWGIKNKKKVSGFDAPIKIVKKWITKKKLKEINKEAEKIINKYNWKDWNKLYLHKQFDKFFVRFLDQKKHKLRQKKMLENIRKTMIKDGKILILTGAYHLRFFEQNLKRGIFLLRK